MRASTFVALLAGSLLLLRLGPANAEPRLIGVPQSIPVRVPGGGNLVESFKEQQIRCDTSDAPFSGVDIFVESPNGQETRQARIRCGPVVARWKATTVGYVPARSRTVVAEVIQAASAATLNTSRQDALERLLSASGGGTRRRARRRLLASTADKVQGGLLIGAGVAACATGGGCIAGAALIGAGIAGFFDSGGGDTDVDALRSQVDKLEGLANERNAKLLELQTKQEDFAFQLTDFSERLVEVNAAMEEQFANQLIKNEITDNRLTQAEDLLLDLGRWTEREVNALGQDLDAAEADILAISNTVEQLSIETSGAIVDLSWQFGNRTQYVNTALRSLTEQVEARLADIERRNRVTLQTLGSVASVLQDTREDRGVRVDMVIQIKALLEVLDELHGPLVSAGDQLEPFAPSLGQDSQLDDPEFYRTLIDKYTVVYDARAGTLYTHDVNGGVNVSFAGEGYVTATVEWTAEAAFFARSSSSWTMWDQILQNLGANCGSTVRGCALEAVVSVRRCDDPVPANGTCTGLSQELVPDGTVITSFSEWDAFQRDWLCANAADGPGVFVTSQESKRTYNLAKDASWKCEPRPDTESSPTAHMLTSGVLSPQVVMYSVLEPVWQALRALAPQLEARAFGTLPPGISCETAPFKPDPITGAYGRGYYCALVSFSPKAELLPVRRYTLLSLTGSVSGYWANGTGIDTEVLFTEDFDVSISSAVDSVPREFVAVGDPKPDTTSLFTAPDVPEIYLPLTSNAGAREDMVTYPMVPLEDDWDSGGDGFALRNGATFNHFKATNTADQYLRSVQKDPPAFSSGCLDGIDPGHPSCQEFKQQCLPGNSDGSERGDADGALCRLWGGSRNVDYDDTEEILTAEPLGLTFRGAVQLPEGNYFLQATTSCPLSGVVTEALIDGTGVRVSLSNTDTSSTLFLKIELLGSECPSVQARTVAPRELFYFVVPPCAADVGYVLVNDVTSEVCVDATISAPSPSFEADRLWEEAQKLLTAQDTLPRQWEGAADRGFILRSQVQTVDDAGIALQVAVETTAALQLDSIEAELDEFELEPSRGISQVRVDGFQRILDRIYKEREEMLNRTVHAREPFSGDFDAYERAVEAERNRTEELDARMEELQDRISSLNNATNVSRVALEVKTAAWISAFEQFVGADINYTNASVALFRAIVDAIADISDGSGGGGGDDDDCKWYEFWEISCIWDKFKGTFFTVIIIAAVLVFLCMCCGPLTKLCLNSGMCMPGGACASCNKCCRATSPYDVGRMEKLEGRLAAIEMSSMPRAVPVAQPATQKEVQSVSSAMMGRPQGEMELIAKGALGGTVVGKIAGEFLEGKREYNEYKDVEEAAKAANRASGPHGSNDSSGLGGQSVDGLVYGKSRDGTVYGRSRDGIPV